MTLWALEGMRVSGKRQRLARFLFGQVQNTGSDANYRTLILISLFALQLNGQLLSLLQSINLSELVVSKIRLSSR